MKESLYDILGVSRSAAESEIKKAYRKLARELHPDVNPGDAVAEERFKQVSAAYDVLGDPERRKAYDEFGEDATRVGFNPEEARAHKAWREQAQWRPGQRHARSRDRESEIFESLFGRRQQGPRKGMDLHAELPIDFRTAALGGVHRLTFGDGTTKDVRIPPGVDDGGSIRLRGQGTPGVDGGPPGDLLITLHIEPDPIFRREGLNLHIDLPVTVVEAVRGATIEVPTLTGNVALKVPPGAQTGQTLRLRGRGIPHRKHPPGHLLAHLQVYAPDGPVSDDILSALAAAYSADIRHNLWEDAS